MMLEARQVGDEVTITTRFARYYIEGDDEQITLEAPGLSLTYLWSDFPDDASLFAVALYLVGQQESQLLGTQ